MADRAIYLSRTLLSRIRSSITEPTDQGISADREEVVSPESLISKVLAVEEGITDGQVIQLIASALPRVTANTPASDREIRDFADFLRVHLNI